MTDKVNRLKELNKLWFKLTRPKLGDRIQFRFVGGKKLYTGKIIEEILNEEKKSVKYRVESNGTPVGNKVIEIVKCNNIMFSGKSLKYSVPLDKFKPL